MTEPAQIDCPRCHGTMHPGFILDTGYGHSNASTWVEGELADRPWATQLEGRERAEVVTFRCQQCGYLESYARSES